MPSPQNAWVFTLCNYTKDDIIRIIQVFQRKDKSGKKKFSGIFGKEIGKDGLHHLQGLIYGSDKKFKFLWSQINLALGHTRTHWDAKKYSMFSAWAYCAKGRQSHEEWEELGIEGPNWHEEWDGHDCTTFKEQLPKLLDNRKIPVKTTEELIDEFNMLESDDREACANAKEREEIALKVMWREMGGQ
jgi:hypothetical protein